MRELLIASANEGKVREIRQFLDGTPFVVVGLKDKHIEKDVEEVGNTFEGNAIIKAMTYGKWSDTLTLADDSGLEIDALDGKPGVQTKRYGENTPDHGCSKLLAEMRDVPEGSRGAQTHSVIAIYDPASDKVRICEGIARGTITPEPVGQSGFGQDPIFRSAETGKTFAEMTIEEKNAISHRGKALKEAKAILLAELA